MKQLRKKKRIKRIEEILSPHLVMKMHQNSENTDYAKAAISLAQLGKKILEAKIRAKTCS